MTIDSQRLIVATFNQLSEHYGQFNWWDIDDPFEVMLGAILVQNTNWRNADKALRNLGTELHPVGIEQLPLEELAQRIRPSGYYNQKALKLKALNQWYAGYDYRIELVRKQSLAQLRQELLAIKGIGGETADAILVYAIGKPSFVIDAYARRIFERLGLTVPKSYDSFKALMENTIEADTWRYGYYHGLLVEHGQQFCHPKPKCDGCPLSALCRYSPNQ